MDLTFPHHENENIQYFSLYNKPITKTWLRTGQIMFQEQKMSKSLNNVILASDFLKNIQQIIWNLFFCLIVLQAP